MAFKVPNQFRITTGPLASDISFGRNGAFSFNIDGVKCFVIASDGEGWEHVSAHIIEDGKQDTPTWEEMCYIKDLFWGEGDCVVQYHPPRSEYVNNMKHCLHLWRPTEQLLPMPPAVLVGIKKTIDVQRCYVEDYGHENGNYENSCNTCGERFVGHKRRVTCKMCVSGEPNL